jgi:hypothetical protein
MRTLSDLTDTKRQQSTVQTAVISPPGLVAAPADKGLWVDMLGLVVLASILRLYHVTSQMWGDEVAALVNSVRRPLARIATQPASTAVHPLYELLAHGSIRLFGENAAALRLPSALLGVASVPLFYLLVRRLAGRLEGLLAGGIAAVSYYCIWFSQDARGYMTMVFFGLVATLLLLPLPAALSTRARRSYVVAVCLGAYTIPFGVCILGGQFAVAVPGVWWRRRQRGADHAAAPWPLIGLFLLAGVASVALYLPLLGHTAHFASTVGHESGSGSRLSFAGFPELMSGLRRGLGGSPGLLGAVAIGLIGTVDYLRRHPIALGLLAAPAVLTVAALIVLGVGVHPRYLMIAVLPAIAVASRGIVVIGRAVGRFLAGAGLRVPGVIGAALVLIVILVSAKPLPRYYRLPKQDYLGALRVVDTQVGPGDKAAAAALAGDIIHVYYRPTMPNIQTVAQLEQAEASAKRLFVITTLEGLVRSGDQPVFQRLHQRYRLVRVLPGTVEDGEMRIYVSVA